MAIVIQVRTGEEVLREERRRIKESVNTYAKGLDKTKFRYKTHLLTNPPYESVNVTKKSWIKQLCCKHKYHLLVREVEGQFLFDPDGDIIVNICPKCGKTKGEPMFWEHEGWGYK